MKYSLALVLALFTSAQAATVAVIDSGVDYLHQQLAHKMWLNPIIEYKGEFPKATNGWNFVENNNQIFNHSLVKNFNSDVFKFFEVEARYNAGSLTAADKQFLAEKLTQDLLTKVSQYGGYAHGTHVAGIVAKNTDHDIMGIKYIATGMNSILEHLRSSKAANNLTDDEKFQYYLAYIAKGQGENFGRVVRFLKKHVADVANGSFSAPYKQIQQIADTVFQEIYKKEPTDEESFKAAYILQYYVLEFYKQNLSQVKDTLFVFAAGNESTNNDIYPASPANVNIENTITVAATNGTASLANFSNYGVKTVEIAAPGVNIYSAGPGTNNVPMSGTSQAAPYVARVAGLVKDTNPKLTPAQIKKILMGTVDKKEFLKKKVKSGGIVNEKRALKAAELAKKVNLDRAIYEANAQIAPASKSLIEIPGFDVEELRFVQQPSPFAE